VLWYPHSFPPPAADLKPGYAIRIYRENDAPEWAALLNACGELGVWTQTRVEGELRSKLAQDNQFFATLDGALVAGAGLYDDDRLGMPCWEIGWVVTHPQHQGLGLARQVTSAAVEAALSLPRRQVFLMTDDHRMPAVKLYLKMGFVPDLGHESFRHRWSQLGHQLGPDYSDIIARHLEG
jgi:mycothiol synthase